MLRYLAIVFLFVLSLSGCVSTKSTPPPSLQQQTWREHGIFSYRDQQQNFMASYVWKNKPTETHVYLIGALGIWHAELIMTKQHVELALSDGRRFTGTHAENLMQHYLGWSFPVRESHYWLWGMPAPKIPSKVQKNVHGDITQIMQQNWVVQLSDYQDINGYYLPSRLTMHKDDKYITIVTQGYRILPDE